MPRSSVCNGEEVVCNCTADCNDVIHWWNDCDYFCIIATVKESGITLVPVRVEVLRNDCISNSGTFTSQLSFNVSLDVTNNTDTQIGCYISPIQGGSGQIFPNNTCTPTREPSDQEQNTSCTPIREPSDQEQNSNITLHVTNCTGMEKHIITVLQPPP